MIPQALDWPLASTDEILSALLALAGQFRTDADRPGLRLNPEPMIDREELRSDIHLFIGGKRLPKAVLDPLLPDIGDSTLEQYGERLCQAAEAADVMLYVTGLQRFTPTIWKRACEFLIPLYESVGLPAGYADLELFMGRYRATPGGVHRDQGTNFHFVISGQKKMHLWPRPDLSEALDPAGEASSDSRRFQTDQWMWDLGHGLSLAAASGDVFHWAIEHWHVGDSPEFSVSLNIALYLNGSPWKLVESALSRALALANASSYPFDPRAEDWHAQGFPSDVSRIFDRLAGMASLESIEALCAREWLRKMTSFGFAIVPPPEASPVVQPGDVFKRTGVIPVLYRRVGGRLLYSANGHVDETIDSPRMLNLFDQINRLQPECEQFVMEPSCDEDVTRKLEVVRRLVQMRAVKPTHRDLAACTNDR
ncbi:hypothetical protein [Caballeronia humi]|uniref:Uncharacterized protein n=1 Tax=Caballeronia humi TaxID=326474 RepID=A0A158ITD7_9BURK|nr:hypothetical protein [Caballeronia humi]SAL59837.1 hypothetical protein AWB65_05379 [Caballeronia humi]